MPRKARKMQAPVAPQDATYGESGDQLAAQQAMGIPDNASAPPMADQMATMPAPGQSGNITDPNQILALLQQQAPPPPGGLARPSDRPDEPLLAGASVPAPPQRNRAAEALEQMAAVTGDDRFVRMAQRARMV